MWEASMHYTNSKKQNKFLTKIEKSKWLSFIESIVKNAMTVQRVMEVFLINLFIRITVSIA